MADNLMRGRKRGRGGMRAVFRKGTSEEPEQEEPILTKEEYLKKKRMLLRRAVLAENQYNALRTRLKENKARELIEYKQAVARKQCPEYLAGLSKAQEELDGKKAIIETRYKMKLGQILDEYEAETDMNRTQFEDQYIYSKNRYMDFFKNLIEEKKKREKEVGIILGALLILPPLPKGICEKPVFQDVVAAGRMTRSMARKVEEGPSTSS
ncbi:Protein CBG19411 [Caenorhabditis briggsae]|uniref:Uncharacterized protein n=4 Tax=Caenorhabditis briggsae TaxID=6238 RepID=A0AAE9F8D3_CAEBR|nr:Protein CBG19411 [Caenorhabditis briggsae]ULT91018.1 hypothetical protein L3Y34_008957 [Caenorhabditis briggsae]UMM36789.1 hypothetical protein L5515_008795 [Caenorhabditis briggsae]CAP36666.1 Protein CBG19411 [Caenorhabditis briggsae]